MESTIKTVKKTSVKKPEFVRISPNEIKFKYKEINFLLIEKDYGVYSIGKIISLFQLDGLKKEFIKGIGCTKSDNHGGEGSKTLLLQGIQNVKACEDAALKYLKSLLD